MFEKEAKERAEEIEANQTLGVYDNDEDLARDEGWNDGYVSGYEEGFQKGAEYGYNKAKEEDKWHYPSKGEYPKDEKEVLVYMWGSFYIGNYKHDTDDNNGWHFNDFDEESEQVTAWKEIIPPKED